MGLRDQVRIGASGKVATGVDLAKRLVQGADDGDLVEHLGSGEPLAGAPRGRAADWERADPDRFRC